MCVCVNYLDASVCVTMTTSTSRLHNSPIKFLLLMANEYVFHKRNNRVSCYYWRGQAKESLSFIQGCLRMGRLYVHPNRNNRRWWDSLSNIVDIDRRRTFISGAFDFHPIFFSPSFFITLIIMELSMLLCERREHNGNGWRQRWRKHRSWIEHAWWMVCALPMSRNVRHWFIYHSEIRRSLRLNVCEWKVGKASMSV